MDFAINGRLPEFLKAFKRHRPEIRLDLVFMGSIKQHEALLADKIDVGFMIGPFPTEATESFSFDNDSYVALLPATHSLSKVKHLRLADLSAEPFILGSGEHWQVFRNELFPICHRRGFHPNIVQEASSSDGIFGLVAAGTGVSIYASCVQNIQRRGIVVRPLDDVPDRIPTCAIWTRPIQSPSLEVFKEFMISVWGATPQYALARKDVACAR